MSEYVTVTHEGGIAIIMIDNPPVNAMSFHLRQPLYKAIEAARDDASVEGVVRDAPLFPALISASLAPRKHWQARACRNCAFCWNPCPSLS